jgi:plastocyanin
MTARWIRIAPLGAAAVLLAALAVGRGGRVAADTASVSINNFAFTPATVSLGAGGTVEWTNNQSGVMHTVTADDGSFDSGRLSTGQTFSHTFSAAGTFAYHCSIHASMHGTAVVSAGGAATAVPEATVAATVATTPTGPQGRSVSFHAGFSLASLPAGTTANADAAFGFDPQANSYHSLGPNDQPIAGQGYWLYFAGDQSVTLGAGSNAPVTINAAPGTWNLIGNPSGTQAALVTGAGAVFTFDQSAGYVAATMLQPGQGAWAFSGAGGPITIAPGATAPSPTRAPTQAPVTTPQATVAPVQTPAPTQRPGPNPGPYGY